MGEQENVGDDGREKRGNRERWGKSEMQRARGKNSRGGEDDKMRNKFIRC